MQFNFCYVLLWGRKNSLIAGWVRSRVWAISRWAGWGAGFKASCWRASILRSQLLLYSALVLSRTCVSSRGEIRRRCARGSQSNPSCICAAIRSLNDDNRRSWSCWCSKSFLCCHILKWMAQKRSRIVVPQVEAEALILRSWKNLRCLSTQPWCQSPSKKFCQPIEFCWAASGDDISWLLQVNNNMNTDAIELLKRIACECHSLQYAINIISL